MFVCLCICVFVFVSNFSIFRYPPLVACILRHSCSSANLASSKGRTALHYAVRASRRKEGGDIGEVVSFLLPHTDVNAVASDGHTPLMDAIGQSDLPIVEMLVKEGANLNFQSRYGETPLWYAVRRNNNHIFDYIFTQIPRENLSLLTLIPNHGLSCLFVAASNGNDHIVTSLISVLPKEEIDLACPVYHKPFKDVTYMTPLWISVHNKNIMVSRVLLEQGSANPNLAETLHRRTCLHEAAWSGNLEVVRLLIQHGAKSSAVERDGGSPLMDAVYQGHHLVVEALLPYSAAVLNYRDTHQCAPIHYAAARGSVRCLKLLLKCHEINIDLKGKSDLTAEETVEKLAERVSRLLAAPDQAQALYNECELLKFFHASHHRNWKQQSIRYEKILRLFARHRSRHQETEVDQTRGRHESSQEMSQVDPIFVPPIPKIPQSLSDDSLPRIITPLASSLTNSYLNGSDALDISANGHYNNNDDDDDLSMIMKVACTKCKERRRWSRAVAMAVLKLFSEKSMPTAEDVEEVVLMCMP